MKLFNPLTAVLSGAAVLAAIPLAASVPEVGCALKRALNQFIPLRWVEPCLGCG